MSDDRRLLNYDEYMKDPETIARGEALRAHLERLLTPNDERQMKIVYVAGPYGDAGGYLQIDRNIAQAREACADLAAAGIGYVCPHLNSAHMEAVVPDVPVAFWYALDEELLKRVGDAILILPRWHDSSGTLREMRFADELGKPAFYYGDRSEELYAGEWANLLEWARS